MKKVITNIKWFLGVLKEKRLTTIAGAWVYFFLLAIVPLIFLLLTAFGFFGVDISLDLVAKLPNEFSEIGKLLVQTASNVSNGFTIFFAITVLFSCYSLLNQMSKDGYSLYGYKLKQGVSIKRRVLTIVALAVLFAIFLFSALMAFFGNTLLERIRLHQAGKVLTTILFFFLLIGVSYVIIVLLNRYISPIRLPFSVLAIGSLVSLAVIVLGTIGFTVYLRFFNSYNAFYGSLATIIVFLLWCYIFMLGLLLGVIVNTILANKEKSTKRVIKRKKLA